MSLFSHLVDKIREEANGGGMVGPATTQGNPSVDYLPSGFTSMKNMLRSLNPVKKKWKLEVLEDKGNYNIQIEDAMSISVPKQHFEHFNNNVYNVIGKNILDLTEMINEAATEEIEVAYEKIGELLSKLRTNPRIQQTTVLMNQWLMQFPNSRSVNNYLINLNVFDRDIQKTISRLKNNYKEDLGKLEVIINNLEDSNFSSMFNSSSENFIGVSIVSKYNDVSLALKLGLDFTLVPSQTISVDSKDIAANLQAYKSVKVSNNEIYPIGQMFPASFFKTLKEEINELAGEE